MLKGISPLLGPELLATLCRMGHGDEIVLADAHFPGHTMGRSTLRADGVNVPDLLDAILPLFELDSFVDDPVVMMSPVAGDTADPAIEQSYIQALNRHSPGFDHITFIERYPFYERAKTAFCSLMAGDTHKYACIILKKGVTPAPG